jgi:predicted phage tail component-like protein
MYGYSRLEKNNDIVAFEPSDNMTINSVTLDRVVDGYRQLTVTGRGLVAQSVKTTSISGRRGVWVEDISEPERILEIKYQLTADSSSDLRNSFNRLNEFLRSVSDEQKMLEVSFKDEPDYIYYAIFNGADAIEENALTIVSRFSLLVPEGFKKSKAKKSTGNISMSSRFEVTPVSITVTTLKATNTVKIISGKQIISFTGAYAENKDIVIEFKQDEVKATYEGRSILSELDLFSDLENFKVKNLDIITATNAIVKEVVWRDEKL